MERKDGRRMKRHVLKLISFFLLRSIPCILSYEGQRQVNPSIYSDEYLEYLRTFDKDINRMYDPQRIASFTKTWDLISAHNADESSSFRLGLSEFADWTEHELSTRFKSWDQKTTEKAGKVTKLSSSSSSPPPPLSLSSAASIDWSNNNNPLGYAVTPPVQNQLSCGGCWAFAASEAVSISVNINEKFSPDSGMQYTLSAEELLDCDRNEINQGCAGGSPQFAYQYIVNNGITSAIDYPFTDGMSSSCAIKSYGGDSQMPPVAGILGFFEIPEGDEEGIRSPVDSGAVSIGICANDPEFMFYSSGILDYKKCCIDVNHAVVIVGYGTDDTTGMDFWLIQNSWGNSWGENGYMRILRQKNKLEGTGMCGLAITASYPAGGYVIRAGEGISFCDRIMSIWYAFLAYVETNWIDILYTLLGSFIIASVSVFVYVSILDFVYGTDMGRYDDGSRGSMSAHYQEIGELELLDWCGCCDRLEEDIRATVDDHSTTTSPLSTYQNGNLDQARMFSTRGEYSQSSE